MQEAFRGPGRDRQLRRSALMAGGIAGLRKSSRGAQIRAISQAWCARPDTQAATLEKGSACVPGARQDMLSATAFGVRQALTFGIPKSTQ